MKLIQLLMILGLFLLGACSSGSKTAENDGSDENLEALAGDDEFVDDELVVDSEEDEFADDDSDAKIADAEEIIPSESLDGSGEFSHYTVQKYDTLLFISFKVYGEVAYWRNLLQHNPGVTPDTLAEGQVLKYERPAQEFIWEKNGNPWMIRLGDTLGIISSEVYGTQAQWKAIYNNNRQMIKNPNLIYAGFTLYTPEKRELASE